MKKPDLPTFIEALRKTGGNLSQTADILGAARVTIHSWIAKDKRFEQAVREQRGRTLDSLVKTAISLAQGIPLLKDGKRVGWKEEPITKVLVYLIGKLGASEGFGDKVDITSNGESIKPDPIVVEVIDSREKVDKADEEE